MIYFFCPSCKQQLSVSDENAGRLLACSHCSQQVTVPGLQAPISATIVPVSPARSKSTVPVWIWIVVVPVGLIFTCCGGCGILAMIGGRVDRSDYSSRSPSVSSPDPSTVISDLQWQEVDSVYNIKSRTTDLQKSEQWKNYEGKRIKWTGRVAEVGQSFGTTRLQIKMNESTFTSDLIVSLKDDQSQKALKLRQGDVVTFVGTLVTWGSLLPMSLSDGEIID